MDDELAPQADQSGDATRQRIERARALQNAARLSAIAGIVYAVLFIVSMWLLTDVPRSGSSEREFVDYYQSDQSNVVSLVALYLMPFSGIAFLWFIVTLRMWIATRAERKVSVLLSNIQLVSGVIFLALSFCAAAALSVVAVASDLGDGTLAPVVALEFPQFGSSLFFVFAIRMGAMFVFTTTNIGRASKIMPTWFVLVGLAVGLVMLLSASFNRGLIVVFPAWVLVLCILILVHARQAARHPTEFGSHGGEALRPAPEQATSDIPGSGS